jgi:hypothetical protein
MWNFLPTSAFHDTAWTMAGTPDLTPPARLIECDSCGEQMIGYQMGELQVQGWRLHSTGRGKPLFVMCAACESRYSPHWEAA